MRVQVQVLVKIHTDTDRCRRGIDRDAAAHEARVGREVGTDRLRGSTDTETQRPGRRRRLADMG